MPHASGEFPFRSYRPGQLEALEEVRAAFAAGKRFVVLEAPTGSGKSAIGVTLGAGEEPGFPAESQAAQSYCSSGNAPVFEEAGEPFPALKHLVDGLGDRRGAREPGPLATHPLFQLGDERCAPF